jgi:branched-chain amino acid transport system substrate-binding protein
MENEQFTVGMVNPLSGNQSSFGERATNGVDLALSAVNNVGIKERDLNIIVEDSESQLESGVNAARKLIEQDEVPMIIGGVDSTVTISIYESLIQDSDIVQLSHMSTSPDISDMPGLLRVSPRGTGQAAALANLLEDDGHESVAITFINTAYGQGLADAFAERFSGEVLYRTPHEGEQSTYSSIVTEMDNSGADAWLWLTFQPEVTQLALDAFDQGLEIGSKVYGTEGAQGDSVLEQVPEGYLNGLKLVAPSAAVEQENYQDFASRYNDEYGSDPTVWSTFPYDAVITTALAIQAAGEFTGPALKEVLRDVTRPEGEEVFTYQEGYDILADGGGPSDINYQGVSGPLDLDENGDPKSVMQLFEIAEHEYNSVTTLTA